MDGLFVWIVFDYIFGIINQLVVTVVSWFVSNCAARRCTNQQPGLDPVKQPSCFRIQCSQFELVRNYLVHWIVFFAESTKRKAQINSYCWTVHGSWEDVVDSLLGFWSWPKPLELPGYSTNGRFVYLILLVNMIYPLSILSVSMRQWPLRKHQVDACPHFLWCFAAQRSQSIHLKSTLLRCNNVECVCYYSTSFNTIISMCNNYSCVV